MATAITSYTRYDGGIADFDRLSSLDNSYAFGRSIDVRTNPQNITVLPRTIKESGTIIQDLPKWAETFTSDLTTYIYDASANIYSRTSSSSYSLLRTVPNSHGNGLVYSQEDNYLWYSSDKAIGRYGPLNATTPTFTDNVFGSLGGVPLNTNSLDLEASSSQYASRADSASLSITGDICLEAQIKPESLPAAGSSMTLISKWTENGNIRSYKLAIGTVADYFGNGSDGPLTISSNTTESPIDSACTGAVDTYTLSATNASFAQGQIILIHQTQGSGAGSWMRNEIQSYTAGTITLVNKLNTTYTSGAQVRVVKQYTSVTISSGATYSAKAWNGTTGGLLAFIANGALTVNFGTAINGSGKGFRGGAGSRRSNGTQAYSGESYNGLGSTSSTTGATVSNNNGGGGNEGKYALGSGGGQGGGYGSNGLPAATPGSSFYVGQTYGSVDATALHLGSGGGGGYDDGSGSVGGDGGSGGGLVFITASNISNLGGIHSDGSQGSASTYSGGSGSGGMVVLKFQTASLGTGLVTAQGGASAGSGGGAGGTGGDGRIHADYLTSYTGTTTPTLNATQDNELNSSDGYSLSFSISSTGINIETMYKPADIQVGVWQDVAVSWSASTSIATFMLNGVSLGTVTGSLTSINDNASTFNIGMDRDSASNPQHFYDGLIDEVRVFNTGRSVTDVVNGISSQIPINTPGLQGYYKLNNDYTDSTSNANNLTSSGSPVFTTDVPFPSPTTRLDIDQVPNPVPSGNVYNVPTAISESSADRLTFTPSKDPQKSIQFNIGNIGTGTWTITIHDSLNNVMATSTVLNANMHTGNFEFNYTNVFRPLTNFTNEYHAHITCASGSPTVVTGSLDNLETADYVTYYQFLVEDTEWHPMGRFLNFWVVGNERYVGKYEAPLYEPNKLVFQAGYRVRCMADWREFKAFGVMKGNNITDFDNGRIYFWDGAASTFNFYIDVPEGGINAMLGSRGKLYIWAGYKNQLLVYEGGDSASKLKDMPNIELGSYSEIYPQGVTMWRSLLRYAVAGNGNSTNLQKAVYTWGSTNLRYPEILTCDYPVSAGVYTGTDLKIGLACVVDQKLLIGWKNGTGAGIDYIEETNPPFINSYIDFLVTDLGDVVKEKSALTVVASYMPLETGESVALSYDMDASGIFISDADTPITGSGIERIITSNSRFYEAQVRLTLTSALTSPTIRGLSFVANTLDTEKRY